MCLVKILFKRATFRVQEEMLRSRRRC
jgi:hypothetical protein